MERKIGEIFEYNGEWYQTVEAPIDEHSCNGCQGCKGTGGPRIFGGECNGNARKDNKFVIFKKLEKVGEPYIIGDKLIQRYKIYPTTYHINVYGWYYQNLDVKSWTIDIEIKQTKENMEEYRMHDAKEDIPEFDKAVDECLFGEDKLNLKPFDLEAAKAGKPVCTRDGRKARIICFDAKGDPCPIIALVEENNIESAYRYDKNGQNAYKKSELDLMMFPEKKEGWVNVYKGGLLDTKSYPTKKEAFDKACPEGYVDTIKINWSE